MRAKKCNLCTGMAALTIRFTVDQPGISETFKSVCWPCFKARIAPALDRAQQETVTP